MGYSPKFYAAIAEGAANEIRYKFETRRPSTALVLGYGWDVLQDEVLDSIELKRLSHFSCLDERRDYKKGWRTVDLVEVGGKKVVVLRNPLRIHESPTDFDLMLVRLQFEMLCALGLRRIVLTDMGASLTPEVGKNTILVVDEIMHHLVHRNVRTGHEHKRRQHTPRLIEAALSVGTELNVVRGSIATVSGPALDFEECNRRFVAESGVSALGLGLLDGADAAAVNIPPINTLCLSLIVGDWSERLDHEENLAKAENLIPQVHEYLHSLIASL